MTPSHGGGHFASGVVSGYAAQLPQQGSRDDHHCFAIETTLRILLPHTKAPR